jgi:hypothetical protein
MKRVVNDFVVRKQIATILNIKLDFESLALWTILSLRWPQLAEYIMREPDKINLIGRKPGKGKVPEHLEELFFDRDKTVQKVVNGDVEGTRAQLTPRIVKKLAGLRATLGGIDQNLKEKRKRGHPTKETGVAF